MVTPTFRAQVLVGRAARLPGPSRERGQDPEETGQEHVLPSFRSQARSASRRGGHTQRLGLQRARSHRQARQAGVLLLRAMQSVGTRAANFKRAMFRS